MKQFLENAILTFYRQGNLAKWLEQDIIKTDNTGTRG